MPTLPRALARALLVLAVLPALHVLADVDAEVRSGDTVTGTIDPATETETFRIQVPATAKLQVRTKGAQKAKAPRIEIRSPSNASLFGGAAPASVSPRIAVATSGEHRVLVRSFDGVAKGGYTFVAKWTTPQPKAQTLTVAPAEETAAAAFSVDAGARVKIEVKATSPTTLPRILGLDGPGGPVAIAVDGAGARVERAPQTMLDRTGDYVLRLDDASGFGGTVSVKVTVRPPKASKRKIDISSKKLGAGGGGAYAQVLSADGGTVAVPAGVDGLEGLVGTSVEVAPGVLPVGTALFIGTAPDFAFGSGGITPVGAPVSFGPEGLRFGSNAAPGAVISIPVNLAAVGGDTSKVQVYTRDAKGKISLVPTSDLDFITKPGFVSLPTSHFSSYLAATDQEVPTTGAFVTTLLGGLSDAQDVVYALASDDASRLFFVADGTNQVKEVVQSGASITLRSWAGGGTNGADGTAKGQFDFGDVVKTVASDADVVYAGTAHKVFAIDATTGLVTRIAGTGANADGPDSAATATPFRDCSDILVDSNGDVFLVDAVAARVRKLDQTGNLTTVVGTGTPGSNGDSNAPSATQLIGPVAIAERLGTSDYFICEEGRVRIWHAGTDSVETLAGDPSGGVGCAVGGEVGTAARFDGLSSIGFDVVAQRVYVTSRTCDVIYSIDLATRTVSVAFGTPNQAGFVADGPVPVGARTTNPRALTSISTLVTFVDSGSGPNDARIRFLTPAQ